MGCSHLDCLAVKSDELSAVSETCWYDLLLCIQWAGGILHNIVCESCWQTPSIQLVELYQLKEVIEFCHTAVQRITYCIPQWIQHLCKHMTSQRINILIPDFVNFDLFILGI
jgi:hypothetical protein